MLGDILLDPAGYKKKDYIRNSFNDTCERIIAEIPPSKERSLAIKKMEESLDLVYKAIDFNPLS